MTTSNTNNNAPLPNPPEHPAVCRSHWDAMMATLNRSQAEQFGIWIDDDLASLEIRLAAFGSPRSRAASATGRR